MKSMNGKWWLALVALLCLAPSAFAAKPRVGRCDDRRNRDCRPVPEGGSGMIYLLGAGITCAGAILIRSRESKPKQT